MPPSHARNTLPIQRVRAIVELAERRGWDVGGILDDVGISPILLAEGKSRVTADQATALVQRLWRDTDDELLGLGLAPVPRGTLRLVCFALMGAPSLGEGIRRFESFRRSLPGIPPLALTVSGDEARVGFDLGGIVHPVGLIIDTMLTITHRYLSWAGGRRLPLLRVEVPYAEDPEIDDYDSIFGAPVRFGAAAPALVFDVALLDVPVDRSQDELASFLRNAPAGVLGTRDYSVSLAAQVRRALERGLSGPWPSADDIAAELAMSPQTLRRRLHDEHTSVTRIREQILRDAAIASLVRGDETVTALARRLGFSEASAFSRAFRRWTGSPPGSYQH
ncbi:AraC family transcriptional regulator [Nocardia sp. NPDC003693]